MYKQIDLMGKYWFARRFPSFETPKVPSLYYSSLTSANFSLLSEVMLLARRTLGKSESDLRIDQKPCTSSRALDALGGGVLCHSTTSLRPGCPQWPFFFDIVQKL